MYIHLVNNQLRTFYVIIIYDEIVYHATTIKELYEQFHQKEPAIGHYRTFLKKFKPKPDTFIRRFNQTLTGKTYWFQKVV